MAGNPDFKKPGYHGRTPYMNGKAPKVPPILRAEIIRKSQEGMQSAEVSAWLEATHGIRTCPANVRRIVMRHRAEQADAAKSVVRAELRTYLIPAIERMARAALRAEKMGKRWLERAENLRAKNADSELADELEERALRASDRVTKNSIALLHYAGLDQPDDLNKLAVPAAERRAALLKRLEELTRPQLPPAQNGVQTH